jgi:hypothetical protein
MPGPTPYPDVNELLDTLLSGARSILGEQFIGMYLYGSLALGDFHPATSDIDFLVVTADDLADTEIEGLQTLHERLWAGGSHWARQLEGSYIPERALRRYDPADATHLHVYDGRIFMQHHAPDWVITRYILREHGVVLAGPTPGTLIDPVTARDLRQAVAALVELWWAPLAVSPGRLQEPHYQRYIVLTMCRVLYTLEHGTVASKPAAARWAREALGQRWRGLIDRALGVGSDSEDPVSDTQRFIQYTCAQCESRS